MWSKHCYWRGVPGTVLAILLISGCSIERFKDPIIIPGIDEDLYIDLWEDLYPTHTELTFQVETIAPEECLNVTIATELSKANQRLDLDILAIVPPDNCEPGEAPARGEAPAGWLTPGTYTMEVHLQNEITSRATLEVTPEYYRVDAQEENGFLWRHKELRRVPTNTLWGYVAATNTALEGTAQNWRSQLQALGLASTLEAGYYGYFRIDESGEAVMNPAAATPVALPFLIRFDGNESSVTTLVNSLRQQGPQGMSVKVWSGRGRAW